MARDLRVGGWWLPLTFGAPGTGGALNHRRRTEGLKLLGQLISLLEVTSF